MVKIVGILNVTPDSFSDGGKFDSLESAISQTKKMLKDGADVIDIGAESTRPGAEKISSKEEWRRLEKILPAVLLEIRNFNQEFGKKVETSIDSYHFETIEKCCNLGVDIINDVSGLTDDKIINLIAKSGKKVILMHNLAIHSDPNIIINRHLNVTEEILKWAQEKISYLTSRGISKSQLIFDPGVGFAKDADQSIRILKNIIAYKFLDLPLYVGHSKKRYLDSITIDSDMNIDEKMTDRAQKTLLVSQYLIKNGVDFLRVHDVKENKELIVNG